jgi:hypothetical protein
MGMYFSFGGDWAFASALDEREEGRNRSACGAVNLFRFPLASLTQFLSTFDRERETYICMYLHMLTHTLIPAYYQAWWLASRTAWLQ